MDEPTPDDVEQIVQQAQQLDRWKQAIVEDLRARGQDPDEVRVIVGYPVGDGTYRADELLTPRWMKEARRRPESDV